MRHLTLNLTLAVGIALVGCAAPISFTPAPETNVSQVQPAFTPGDLVLRLRIGDARTLQQAGDTVSIYNLGDIAKLEILPFVKEGDAFVPMSATGKPTTEEAADRLTIETTDPHQRFFILKNLPPNQTYRFQVRAYDTERNLISKDEGSASDVEFTNHPYEHTADIQLKLKDKPFSAAAKAQIRFSDEGMGSTSRLLATLYKKGTPNVQVGQTVDISKAEFGTGRTLVLGGLAHGVTYLLKVEARRADELVLTTGSLEWTVGNETDLGQTTLTLVVEAQATTYGGGASGYLDGPLATARFNAPTGLARGTDGKIYVAEFSNNRIRVIDPVAETVGTLAGSGDWADQDGQGDQAAFRSPWGITSDTQGNLFVTAYSGHNIRKVTSAGFSSLFAGAGQGDADGAALAARFRQPTSLAFDSQDVLYVSDFINHRIRAIANGQVTTLAGPLPGTAGTVSGFANGTGSAARFDQPRHLCVWNDEIYVADTGNRRIRKVTKAGVVTTFAGTGESGAQDGWRESATFTSPWAIAVKDGVFYVSDGHRIRRIGADGQVKTLAGGASRGVQDGAGSQARFYYVHSILPMPDGSLLLADTDNHRIRKLVLP
jgi:hypothetical protein